MGIEASRLLEEAVPGFVDVLPLSTEADVHCGCEPVDTRALCDRPVGRKPSEQKKCCRGEPDSNWKVFQPLVTAGLPGRLCRDKHGGIYRKEEEKRGAEDDKTT